MKIEQKLVEYITKTLVDQPDSVRVDREVDDRGVLLTLHVADDDLGRVIGKGGMTAQSLRLILKALGSKNGERYNLRIADGQPRPETAPEPAADADQPEPADTDSDPPEPAAADKPDSKAAPDPDDDVADSTDNDKPKSAVEQAKSELASLDDLDI